MSAPINRDHARAALSVLRCAEKREGWDSVDAMAAALDTYQRLEEREQAKLTPRQVSAIRKALGMLLLVALPVFAQAQEPVTFRAMFYCAAGERPEMPEAPGAGFELTMEQGERSLVEHAFTVYLPGGLADALSTEYFLAAGGREANPAFRSRWVRAPYKLIAEPLAAAWAERWIEGQFGHRAALVFRGVMWGSRFLVAVHNVRYGRSLRAR